MRVNTVRDIIASGRPVVNAWISGDGSYAAEVLSHAGFDSVTLDAQHGMFGRDRLLPLLQAVSAGPAVPMVRPSRMDIAEIGWLLDAGAYGIIAPSVDTPQLAQDLVDACLYPPHGRRSFGASRGLLYGGADYVERASDTVMPWAMIESRSAVEHLEGITATPGLYGVYVGPNDLALDLGLAPGNLITDQVADIALTVMDRAHACGIAAGIFCRDGEEAAHWARAGFDLVTPGNDTSYLRSAAAQRLSLVRGSHETTSGGGY